ncbi:ABC transporter substrate-binding protein [Marivirga tractuosa]|uniref:Extracellular solute-binding protein family 1 n=1 Tax=Marivirga tractuosa (strain ATCC 23168 / DSM 4126 / NBRC 15989 / NCIMB 1408 / VKM B-1430 / H-43) TaxID=643867 RepID=E4TLF0_MARTH|nr:ABC transporter substrate-binding protein [Marivirga tractuosa]ADR21271.1 extracellular solute-binding protein family 1 [Marivirga tractuosa DSM 4126]BDD14275.1 ABC transporter substrate-binding protein [Marivirga tractuosa]
MQKFTSFLLLAIAVLLMSCTKQEESKNWKTASWDEITQEATGTSVNFMMWQGSPVINDYINNYVKPTLKKNYNITLNISSGQGPEIVQLMMGEKQANSKEGQVDMVWINGETFFQLRKIEALWGPFTEKLPNSKYIDFKDPFIGIDFQQAINGMECPWGISQFAFVYDTAKTPAPPKTLAELEIFVKTHPGTFTISNDFSGMTVLKCFMAELSGKPDGLDGEFNQQKYDTLSTKLWDYINRNRKYFWKEGQTFPKEHSKMDQMFASGEILLSYGFSEGGIEDKVSQGLFPKSTKGYAWENGTVLNSNYLGITYNAKNKAGAMQVINFLISPEAQLKRAEPSGMNANPVLDIAKLPEEYKTQFEKITARQFAPSLDELSENAIKEPAPEYMLNIYEDFRTYVIEK